MSKILINRVSEIAEAVDNWLHKDNLDLKLAIDRTVNEGLFGIEDLKYQVRWLKKSVTEESLHQWAEQSGASDPDNPKNVLCLHAGNLPLVGLQDLLAVVISGHRYNGKVSRKDPYLLPTFYTQLVKQGLIEPGSWSTDLNDFEGRKADAVVFAGSARSAEDVFEKLDQMKIAGRNVPSLIRTAHFSIAHIEDSEPETLRDLVDAVFRYDGQGCRSVAMVVAPFSLHSQKCHFTDYVEEHLLRSPFHRKAPESLYLRYAYNKATGKEVAWLDQFMIEETEMKPSEPHILHWVKGDRAKTAELADNFMDGLQAVYVQSPEINIEGVETELLADAQRPSINWKPDGVDTIEWLNKVF